MASSSTSREYAQLIGVMSGFMAYGIHFTLFVITWALLYKRRRSMRQARFFLGYISLQFALSSVGLWRDIVAEAASYVEHGQGLDDPIQYYNEGYSAPPEWVSVFVYAICTWLQDGLLLYRCYFLYARSKSVIAIPAAVFSASIIASVLFVAQVSMSSNLYDRKSVGLGILYWGLSVSFNIIVTCFILRRLFTLRKRSRDLSQSSGRVYTGIAAMIVESAALYSVTGLVFIICYSQNNPAQYPFLTWLGQTESISPLLIILRVAQGRGFSEDSQLTDTLPTIRFNHNNAVDLPELHSTTQNATTSSGADPETTAFPPRDAYALDSPSSSAHIFEWHGLASKTRDSYP
ncbi:hypothetical protein GLOTRDRAFT_129311 [Gloeophyllum trabeum ATCC 11539]|uniref:Uncharacterized protein n=1 Tax=Gloeophyllum trabeum (strain ATCC 11539 / FP-39264 / Madison 617) TaxID=670483 RepID=S7RKY4_GLOTA|nr:uncharacterized protein GLOTRDRAFT_129311 [Gloeophyllum trabeum ATCC 11539]EPQ55005.1 hypothetical protein GLOTRDRAFT_129311 [Gloeophyllum trabeum ATCC 11539]